MDLFWDIAPSNKRNLDQKNLSLLNIFVFRILWSSVCGHSLFQKYFFWLDRLPAYCRKKEHKINLLGRWRGYRILRGCKVSVAPHLNSRLSIQCWFKLFGQNEQNLNRQTQFSQIWPSIDSCRCWSWSGRGGGGWLYMADPMY